MTADVDPLTCRLLSLEHHAKETGQPDLVRFVSVQSDRPRSTPTMPIRIPATGKWLVKVLDPSRKD